MADDEGGAGSGAAGLIVGAIVVALIVIAGGLFWLNRDDGPPVDTLIVGDSVSYLSFDQIKKQLQPSNVHLEAIPGFTTQQMLVKATGALDDDVISEDTRDLAVVLIGYNDLRLGSADTDSLPKLVELSSTFECSVWFTLPVLAGGEPNVTPYMNPDDVEAWNQRLADEIDQYDNVHLANDWNDVVSDNDPAELLKPDQIHPTDAGKRRLGAAMKAGVDRYCA